MNGSRSHRDRGRANYEAGLSAEEAVSFHYLRRGATILARRWRGRAGEIDLIADEGGEVVFIEVKTSMHVASAAGRVSPAQIDRIGRTALEYLDTRPGGALTPMRIDVALVDAAGRLEVLKNVTMT